MTAFVTIPVATVQSAVKLPNTALRYKPPMSPDDILATYKQYGIEGFEPKLSGGGSSIAAAPGTGTAVVWKLAADNTLVPVKVSIGITDHAFTEVLAVLKGELRVGDAVVIRSVVAKNQMPGVLRR
jgi:hypothetical protein